MNEPLKNQEATPQAQHTPFSLPLSVDEIPSGLELVDAEGRLVASREFTGKNDQAKRETMALIALAASNHARLTAQNAALVASLGSLVASKQAGKRILDSQWACAVAALQSAQG